MQIECSFSAPLYRYAPDDFIRHLDLTVVHYTESDDRIILGKMAADLLPMADVMNAGDCLYDVCDADSAGWEQVHSILFEKDFDFRSELAIEAAAGNVLFIWKTLLHPKTDPYRQGVFETVANLFGSDTVVAMWNYATKLTPQELADLGFKKIADSKLIFRDMTMVTKYSNDHPDGSEINLEFEATKDDEDWVNQRWNDEDRTYVDRDQYESDG